MVTACLLRRYHGVGASESGFTVVLSWFGTSMAALLFSSSWTLETVRRGNIQGRVIFRTIICTFADTSSGSSPRARARLAWLSHARDWLSDVPIACCVRAVLIMVSGASCEQSELKSRRW